VLNLLKSESRKYQYIQNIQNFEGSM